jgi:hypothetical protein
VHSIHFRALDAMRRTQQHPSANGSISNPRCPICLTLRLEDGLGRYPRAARRSAATPWRRGLRRYLGTRRHKYGRRQQLPRRQKQHRRRRFSNDARFFLKRAATLCRFQFESKRSTRGHGEGVSIATAYDECDNMAWEHKHCNDCAFLHGRTSQTSARAITPVRYLSVGEINKPDESVYEVITS